MQPAKVLKGFQDCELIVEGNFLGHVAKMMTRSWLLAQYLKSHDLHPQKNLALSSPKRNAFWFVTQGALPAPGHCWAASSQQQQREGWSSHTHLPPGDHISALSPPSSWNCEKKFSWTVKVYKRHIIQSKSQANSLSDWGSPVLWARTASRQGWLPWNSTYIKQYQIWTRTYITHKKYSPDKYYWLTGVLLLHLSANQSEYYLEKLGQGTELVKNFHSHAKMI